MYYEENTKKALKGIPSVGDLYALDDEEFERVCRFLSKGEEMALNLVKVLSFTDRVNGDGVMCAEMIKF